MPELPEVETVARQLEPYLLKRKIMSVQVRDPKLFHVRRLRLKDCRIIRVRRVGKRVVITLARGRVVFGELAIHLRMTGRLLYSEHAGANPSARASFTLSRGSLHFCDVRRFGTVDFYAGAAELKEQGLEPLSAEFTPEALYELLQTSRQAVKVFLLRQEKIVGLGNIYASEILHAARVSALRPSDSLTLVEARRVQRATRRILQRAIECCGTTFSDFQNATGEIGNFQKFLRVYDREGQPCRACGQPIQRIVQAQRSTYYCSRCQR